jgi:hypothetical protein
MERVAICLRVVLGFFFQAGRIKKMVVAIMDRRFVHGSAPPQGFIGGFYRKNMKVLFIMS